MLDEAELLEPENFFGVRKVICWLTLGPVNPITWTAIFVAPGLGWSPGAIKFLFLWPMSLGVPLCLVQLKKRTTTYNELSRHISICAFAMIPIYTALYIVFTFLPTISEVHTVQDFIMACGLFFSAFYSLSGFGGHRRFFSSDYSCSSDHYDDSSVGVSPCKNTLETPIPLFPLNATHDSPHRSTARG